MMWLMWTMSLLLSNALHGCDSPPPAVPVNGAPTIVTIKGKVFHLEVAAENATRMRGLGGRESIAEDGGMVFMFPRSEWRVMTFVMRDCPIDIDIIYLDGAGRVLAAWEMKAEPARGEGEGKPGEMGNDKYENRLSRRYTSKFTCSFAIELRAGTIQKLGVKEGDRVEMDAEGLKKIAR